MSKNCAKVIAAFVKGQPCFAGSISTDGRTIYSYAMPIARRVIDVKRRVNVLGGKGPTVTTSRHINATRDALALYAATRGGPVVDIVGPAFL